MFPLRSTLKFPKLSRRNGAPCARRLTNGACTARQTRKGKIRQALSLERAESGLNKAVLDRGWFEFRRQLDYKLAWNCGWLIAVPAQDKSRGCLCCGHVSAENSRAGRAASRSTPMWSTHSML